ncbi:MAG TPA: hypothetical protein VFN87_06185 [Solirubrobacteraceae bacterium]|nr:hypothetical protein [Solirubrobacteraceae bacterium]
MPAAADQPSGATAPSVVQVVSSILQSAGVVPGQVTPQSAPPGTARSWPLLGGSVVLPSVGVDVVAALGAASAAAIVGPATVVGAGWPPRGAAGASLDGLYGLFGSTGTRSRSTGLPGWLVTGSGAGGRVVGRGRAAGPGPGRGGSAVAIAVAPAASAATPGSSSPGAVPRTAASLRRHTGSRSAAPVPAPATEAPPVLLPVGGGGASATGVGTGLGATAVALFVIATIWLLELLSGRISLEPAAWRETLLPARLERPG